MRGVEPVREKKLSTREYLNIGRRAKEICDKVRVPSGRARYGGEDEASALDASQRSSACHLEGSNSSIEGDGSSRSGPIDRGNADAAAPCSTRSPSS